MDRELGKSTWGLVGWVGRPSEILNACQDEQRETYLLPTVKGERKEAFALTEPNAGSDAMSIQTRARNGRRRLRHRRQQAFHHLRAPPDFVILFTVTGVDETKKGPRKRITAFLIDVDTPGFELRRGPRPVSHRTYHNYQLSFDDCRVPARNILGEEGKGFDHGGPVAGQHAHPRRRELLRQGRARAGDRQPSGRRPASSSARPSASSRASASSSRTWRPSCAPPTC